MTMPEKAHGSRAQSSVWGSHVPFLPVESKLYTIYGQTPNISVDWGWPKPCQTITWKSEEPLTENMSGMDFGKYGCLKAKGNSRSSLSINRSAVRGTWRGIF